MRNIPSTTTRYCYLLLYFSAKFNNCIFFGTQKNPDPDLMPLSEQYFFVKVKLNGSPSYLQRRIPSRDAESGHPHVIVHLRFCAPPHAPPDGKRRANPRQMLQAFTLLPTPWWVIRNVARPNRQAGAATDGCSISMVPRRAYICTSQGANRYRASHAGLAGHGGTPWTAQRNAQNSNLWPGHDVKARLCVRRCR